MDLPELFANFHDDDACRALLESLRWPNGPVCSKCGAIGERITRIPSRDLWRCNDCQNQFSVRVGTIMQDSKLPLWKWFLATYLIVEAKKGVSSNQLKRMIGVGSYRSAWFLSHRIRSAMGQAAVSQLKGLIEADETFVGGKYRYARTDKDVFGNMKKGPRPDSNKTIVLGALERGGEVRLRMSGSGRGKAAITSFIDDVTDEITMLHSDDLPVYQGVANALKTQHESVNHTAKEFVRGDVHTNGIESVWSLLKRSIVGSYHQLSVKHLEAYLNELEWRFNNRENPNLFRDTLRVLVTADPLTYQELVAD